jgi:hypothetical protein
MREHVCTNFVLMVQGHHDMRHWERGFLWIALQMRLKVDLSRTCFKNRLTPDLLGDSGLQI